jgi:hypothetical protein
VNPTSPGKRHALMEPNAVTRIQLARKFTNENSGEWIAIEIVQNSNKNSFANDKSNLTPSRSTSIYNINNSSNSLFAGECKNSQDESDCFFRHRS